MMLLYRSKIRGLGIITNKYFCIFTVSENVKNLACGYPHAVLAVLQNVEKTFFLQNCFSYNRNHSKRTIFQNEEIKKKRIYSIRKNPFLNFNNISVVYVLQNAVGIQHTKCSDKRKNYSSTYGGVDTLTNWKFHVTVENHTN